MQEQDLKKKNEKLRRYLLSIAPRELRRRAIALAKQRAGHGAFAKPYNKHAPMPPDPALVSALRKDLIRSVLRIFK